MGYNALAVAEPVLFDHGRWIDRFRQGEADALDRGRRDLMRQAGGMVAGGNMRGARNALAVGGELDAAFGIDDRQTAAEDRSWERGWQQKSRARQEKLWGREDQQWGQGQSDAALARKQNVAALYTSAVQAAGGDPAKLAQVQEVLRAAGVGIPQEFSQPGGQEAAAVLAGPGEQMTPYQRAQIDLEKQKLSQGDPGALIEQGKFEQNLRKERSTAVADFRTVADSYARIQAGSADASGAGDIAVVYGYMKMLDPGSVVREGEFATAENTAGVPAQVTAIYNRIRNGERLPPETREQFIRMAGRLYQQKRQEADEIDNRFGTIADQYRVPRSNVILPYGSQAEPPIGQPPQPQPSAPVRIGGDADYNALPPGTQFIAPDGTLRVKP